MFSPGADQVAISTDGTSRLTVSTTAVSSTLAVDHPLGAVGTPSITFTGDLNTGIYSPAADTIAFAEGGVESARIDSSGRLLVGTSTATANGGVLELSGGITFPATAVAASNANTLDDYEEGTWTPVLADATTGGNEVTHSVQDGLYTKVGNVVTVYFRVTWTSKGSASGTVRLRGFPFTAKSTTGAYYYTGSTANSNGQTVAALEGGSTFAILLDTSGLAGQFSELSSSDTGPGINGVLTYLV
jgi:hypothetical protein